MSANDPAVLALIGALADDPDCVGELRDLVEIAVHTRRDLLTATDTTQLDRVRRRRRLLAALYTVSPPVSQMRNDETPDVGDLPSSTEPTTTVSVQEAAEVLDKSPRRIQQLLACGELTGERDGPHRPWRIHVDSVQHHRDRIQETTR